MTYGVWTLIRPEGWQGKNVYNFLDGADLQIVSAVIFGIGCAQLVSAWWHLRLPMMAAGLLGFWQWGTFAWSGYTNDPLAYVWLLYGYLAVSSLVALCRV